MCDPWLTSLHLCFRYDTRNQMATCDDCLDRKIISRLAASIFKAIVCIHVTGDNRSEQNFEHIATGIILGSKGFILTCASVVVVNDFRAKIKVTLHDQTEYDARLMHSDHSTNLATLQIDPDAALQIVELGDSSKIQQGDFVFAVGCPLNLPHSVSAGAVSSIDRTNWDLRNLGFEGRLHSYIQFDCASSQGCFGGPLVDMDGKVIGVNICSVPSSDGINFAVPVNEVRHIVHHFKEYGKVVRPYLGLQLRKLGRDDISYLKGFITQSDFSLLAHGGLYVHWIGYGTPAFAAGIQVRDVLVQLDGIPIKGIQQFLSIICNKINVSMQGIVIRSNGRHHFTIFTGDGSNADGTELDYSI